jgi:hypothetical protein
MPFIITMAALHREKRQPTMSTASANAAPVTTISTESVRRLLDKQRPIQFWNVLTDQWFKGKKHLRLAAGAPGQDWQGGTDHEFAQECGDRRILRRPEVRRAGGEARRRESPRLRGRTGRVEGRRLDRRRGIDLRHHRGSPGGPLNMFRDVRPSALKRKRDRRRSR